MRLLMDTVTFIWAIGSPQRISPAATLAIEPKNIDVEISSIALTEIAIKHAKGRLNLPREKVVAAIERLKLRILPYTSSHAYQFFGLPLHLSDPFDRMIIAQAIAEDIPIVTSDAQFRMYRDLKVIW